MHLRRSKDGHKAVADSYIHYSEIDRYIRIIIDIYSSSEIKRESWLTEREKQFYISSVIHVINGDDNPISDESVAIYKKYFSPTTDKVKISDYINRIRKKGWLKYDKKERSIKIPSIFHGIDTKEDVITFNLRFSYESSDRSTPNGVTREKPAERDTLYSTSQ